MNGTFRLLNKHFFWHDRKLNRKIRLCAQFASKILWMIPWLSKTFCFFTFWKPYICRFFPPDEKIYVYRKIRYPLWIWCRIGASRNSCSVRMGIPQRKFGCGIRRLMWDSSAVVELWAWLLRRLGVWSRSMGGWSLPVLCRSRRAPWPPSWRFAVR